MAATLTESRTRLTSSAESPPLAQTSTSPLNGARSVALAPATLIARFGCWPTEPLAATSRYAVASIMPIKPSRIPSARRRVIIRDPLGQLDQRVTGNAVPNPCARKAAVPMAQGQGRSRVLRTGLLAGFAGPGLRLGVGGR